MRRRIGIAERREVFGKTGGRCAYCGCILEFKEMQVDHAVSLHNHGTDDLSNLMPSCRQCNYYKRGSNVEGFRKKLKRAFARERKSEFVRRLEEKYGGWNGEFWFERNG